MKELFLGLAVLGLYLFAFLDPYILVAIDMIKQGFRTNKIRMIAKYLDLNYEARQQSRKNRFEPDVLKG